jgi:hypothetical protein
LKPYVVFSEWQGGPVAALLRAVDTAVASLPRREDGSIAVDTGQRA